MVLHPGLLGLYIRDCFGFTSGTVMVVHPGLFWFYLKSALSLVMTHANFSNTVLCLIFPLFRKFACCFLTLPILIGCYDSFGVTFSINVLT